MQVVVPGPAVAVLIVLAGIGAYFVLALRLSQNLALAMALFGTCIVGMFVFALRTALEDGRRHDHAD